jgi:hypothetical protein
MTGMERRENWVGHRRLVVVAAAVLLATCLQPGLARAQPADHRHAAAASVMLRLHGTKHVKSYHVGRGKTAIVTGPLTVEASGDIVVDGTVVLNTPGKVSLHAGGRLIIRGTIKPTPPAALPRNGHSAAPPAGRGDGSAIDLAGQAGVTVLASGHISAGPGQPITIYSAGGKPIDIAGKIGTTPGRASQSAAQPGGPGGQIAIGFGFGEYAGVLTVRKGASIQGGAGGNGYTGTSAKIGTGAVNPCEGGAGSGPAIATYAGTDGGEGGDVRLYAKKLVVAGTVKAGDGGKGGDAGTPNSPHPSGLDGGLMQGGADVNAQSGSGGHGGQYFAEVAGATGAAKTAADEAGYAGNGGVPGDIFVSAGNGGPGCDGGQTSARLGAPGFPGVKGKQPKAKPVAGDVELDDGGIGGNGDSTNHRGGDGGSVTIVPGFQYVKVNKKQKKVGPFINKVTIVSYGNGGDGFVNCRGFTPQDGGRGGHGAFLSGPQLANIDHSFNGGKGGDGNPAGAGGIPGGSSDGPPGPAGTVTESFQLGAPGLPCPRASMSVSPPAEDFGQVNVGGSSTPRPETVINNGPGQAKVTKAEITGDGRSEFRIVDDGCTQPLNPGQTCPIDIGFTPATTGEAHATLAITTDGNPASFSIPLTGVGRQIYLYSLSGLSASWDSPLDTATLHDLGDKLTLQGQGCGDTVKAFFEFTLNHTYPYIPPQFADNNYWTLAGTFPIPGFQYLDMSRNLVGEVDFTLSIQNLETGSPTVTMTPKVQGTIPNLQILQASVPLTKTPVMQCPAGYPPP